MRGDYSGLFEVLEPPGGGLARLRARLGQEPRHLLLQLTAASLMVTAIALLLFFPPAGGGREEPDFSLVRLRLGMSEPPPEPLTIPRNARNTRAASRIQLGSERVLFYLVGSVDRGEVRKQKL